MVINKINSNSSIEECSVVDSLLSSSSDSANSMSTSSRFRSASGSFFKYRDSLIFDKYQWIPLCIASIFIFILTLFVVSLVVTIAPLGQELSFCRQRVEENVYNRRLQENLRKLDESSLQLQKLFDPGRIKRNLKWMSRNTHIAGLNENAVLMRRIAGEYERMGFDVRIYNYTVLLNYPDFNHPNSIEAHNTDDDKWWTVSQGFGQKLGSVQAVKEQSDPRSSIWWNAYSGNGSVESQIVYCNYGMPDDFRQLKDWNIDVSGAIALIRYGGISRSEKIREAKRYGAIGVILFSDPIHYTGPERNRTFPDDVFLPGVDAQRGSVLATHGDPLTPLFPSLPYVQRSETPESATEKGYINSLPVMPIGYEDAQRIMDILDGPTVKVPEWKGGLSTFYRLTGSRTFRLNVRSRNAKRTISNIVATLKGREEPDRWVLVGNHVDAWGSGAIDPLSGTATQLEMARVASTFFDGNPPRRSIVFCHWDAEEFGLIGSTEWIEEMQTVLNSRAVAYINVDHISGNTTLDVKSVPLLYRLIVDSAEKIPQMNAIEVTQGRNSLLDSWLFYRGKSQFSGDRSMPEIGLPAGGSDYQRFITFAGVPAADLKMESMPRQSYALYHTMYETFWTVQNLMDPNFSSMLSMGQLWMEIVYQLSNRLVIPFHPLHFAQSLSALFHKAESQISYLNISQFVPRYQEKINGVKYSLRRLLHSATVFQLEIQEISSGQSSVAVSRLEQLNNRLQQLERTMLDVHAFQQPIYRHLLYSPSRHPSHVTVLACLLDPCFDYLENNHNTNSSLEEFVFSFTRLQFAIESAIKILSFE